MIFKKWNNIPQININGYKGKEGTDEDERHESYTCLNAISFIVVSLVHVSALGNRKTN